ncbi:S-layer homology domain-containing protein [Anaerotignum sp.]|uniref:S-layer homology domain-containing protein n=1 Tax=Anaerotignum sp. TaxID=2039241 RepID=UPI0027153AE4|nr:S-layer homology domain-containing protein [Anaerotignum sp.]
MKKRIVSLLLAMVFTISTFSSTVFAAEHADINYSEIEYEHVDPAEFYKVTDLVITQAADKNNYSSVESLISKLVDFWYRVNTQYTLAVILQSKDASDATYNEEYLYSFNLDTEILHSLADTLEIILESPCAGTVYDVLDESELTYILQQVDAGADDVELSSLMSAEKEFINQYYKTANKEYTAVVNGEAMTLDGIKNAKLPEDIYKDAIREIHKNKNSALGEVYINLVKTRAKIARLCGYESYTDYCYENTYFRDFTSEDVTALSTLVKEYIAPINKKLNEIITNIDFSSLNELDYSPETLISREKGVIEKEFPELLESFNYMYDHGFYDIGADDNKADTGFTSLLLDYNVPFMFNKPYGDFNDVWILVHETGHYNRFFISRDILPMLELSEIDSQGLELLFYDFYDDMIGDDKCTDLLKIKLLKSWIRSIIDGCMHDEFQQIIYHHPDMTLSQMNQLYYNLCLEYGYTPTSGYSDAELGESYAWTETIHNFTDPLYYISYAVSMIPAWELWMQAQTDFEEAKERYLQLVNREQADTYMQTLSDLGFGNTFDEATIKELAHSLGEVVDGIELKKVEKPVFSDIANHWARDSIEALADEGIARGTGDKKFEPDKSATLGMYVLMLGKAVDAEVVGLKLENSVEDLTTNYSLYIVWADANNLLTESGDASPSSTITREELAVMLYKYVEQTGRDITVTESEKFADSNQIDVWAKDAVSFVEESKLMYGNENNCFNPQQIATRAEVSSVIYRLDKLLC